jgi:Domain of unknown function (DUF4124)
MRHVVCLLLIALSAPAWSQDGKVYKIVHPDGRVTYSDQPPSGKGAAARELPIAPATSGVQVIDPGKAQEVNARIKADLEERDKRALEEQRAREKLREAEKAKEEGAEPLEGERTGIVGRKGARTRLNEEYDERQRTLDVDLDKARKAAE